ncbi:MAG TPA: RNA polymerase factor sigma-54 [Phycisphaerales bacterium]|nr:RNA polymerase factor sigma-54 [Phycisphaerales bacterium]
MRFDAFQQMRMGQHMKLAPQMIQSMEILQMSLAELQERIEQELESNPTLEQADGDGVEAAPAAAGDTEDSDGRAEHDGDGEGEEGVDGDGDVAGMLGEGERTSDEVPLSIGEGGAGDDFERLEEFEHDNLGEGGVDDDRLERSQAQEYEPRERSGDLESDAKSEAMANTASRAEGVQEQLLEQWHLSDIDPALRALGDHVISFIEDDGYLRTPLEVIADRASGRALNRDGGKPTVAQVEHALKAVQLLLEPAGIGARDTRECLLLQIDARQDEASDEEARVWQLTRALVDGHLDDLANNRLPKVAAKLNVSMEELKGAVDKLRTLRVAPGRQLSSEAPPGIVPDGIVEYDADGDRYIAYLNDRRLPNLRLNQEYALLAKDKTAPKQTREFIRTNMGNAQFLIEAIEQRKRTLLRVLEAVVRHQRDFFDFGPQAIKPLPMTKVAEELGIHVATVSRAVAEKYVQTPRGVVPLRKFFTGGTTTETGEEVSWDAIKAALEEVIAAEDKKDPLSDDALAEELKKRGFDIARRTVAKYRGQLNIPTGRLRKQH